MWRPRITAPEISVRGEVLGCCSGGEGVRPIPSWMDYVPCLSARCGCQAHLEGISSFLLGLLTGWGVVLPGGTEAGSSNGLYTREPNPQQGKLRGSRPRSGPLAHSHTTPPQGEDNDGTQLRVLARLPHGGWEGLGGASLVIVDLGALPVVLELTREVGGRPPKGRGVWGVGHIW